MTQFYELIFSPPVIPEPTGLTLTVAGNGRLGIDLVQPDVATLRYTLVELTYVEDDWSDGIIIVIPLGSTYSAYTGLPEGDVWVRARGADAWGHFSEYTAIETATVTAASGGTMWVPLLDGADGFVWLDHDLIYTEVPTP
jgi:hypothetical protein